ncbi:receptor-type tyrosine-protein phosphatase delta-like [Eriocheir sinensis]|uniref:receptor-type tyrosine-protein phosphatase delta-like n=1 Tax=Eriocheir sinensis TaxID=95602 RepID=UPI0021C9D4A1|nr:receptor-type tyrosine-protein phosphatase delta-like [Eriocheir sinensis]
MPSFSRGVLFLLVFLIAALPLYCSATLDAEERQKEQDERDAITEDARKADMAPEPPQDLEVIVLSDSVVLLTWGEPSDTTDLDHYYVYVEEMEDMHDSSTQIYYQWMGLEACTSYTFGVRSVSTVGDMSDPVLGDGRTDVGRPPPPQNLQGESESSTSMTLTWDKPETLCDIEYYRVKWSLDGVDTQSTQVTVTSHTVSELLPNTTYILSVSAITSVGEGDPATIQETTTAEDESGPPVDLVAVGISTSAINSSWSPPPYNPPQYYTVQALPCDYSVEKVFGLSYLLTGLDPCDSCTIVVTSIYDSGLEFTASTIGKTLGGDPPPPKSCSVEVQDGYPTVSWVAPDSNCALGKYNVLWTSTKLWGDGEEDRGSVNTSLTQYRITEPVPYSDYGFEISASIDGDFGSPTFCSGTSNEALPGPPVILSVASEQGAAVVTWETPAEENGIIVKYGIFVDGEIDPRTQVAGDEHSARVEDLEPCVSVGLTVKALNGAGWGSSSEVKYATVDGDVLPEEVTCTADDLGVEVCWLPYSVSCTAVSQYNLKWEGDVLWSDDLVDSNSTTMDWTKDEACYNISALPYTKYSVELTMGSGDEAVKCSAVTPMAAPGPPTEVNVTTEDLVITVTWSEPEKKNGIIDIYQVTWEDSAGGFLSRTTEDNSTFSSEIQEASCGVTVDVTVMAKVVDVADLGDASPPVTAFLVNSVKTLNCESSKPGQVSLSWTLEDAECPVEFYNLTWTYDSLWSDDAGEGWQNVGKNDISTTVTSLPPYSSVSLQIHVDNNPEHTDCSTTTPEEAPGPPTAVNVTTEGLVITVTWSEPEQKNGIIALYQVEWEDSNNGKGSLMTEDNSTFSSEIQGDSCDLTVDVTVRAKVVTVAELGDASPPVTAYLVNSVKTLNCKSSEPGQVSLSWTLEDAGCPIGSYNLTWTYDSLWSDDAGKGWQEFGKDDTSATVSSLPAYSNVFLQIHVDNNPEHTDCSATTPEEASSKPTSVEQIANSTSSVTVAWGLPLSIRGILNGWRLRWKAMNGDIIDEAVTNPEDMTYEITKLSSSTSYVVYVMAINGAGDGEAEKTDVTTANISNRSPSNTGLIIGLSVGGGILLIILLVGGFILYRKKGSSEDLKPAFSLPEVADGDSDELYRRQHHSSANHHFQNKSGSIDFGTNSELYTNPRPSLSKHELGAGNGIPSAYDRGQMSGAPPSRRFSQQVATSLPRMGAYNRRPSQQVNSRMRNYEEYNRRPSQQDMIGRPSLSGGPGRPPLGEYGRRPSQQIDVGRPNMKEYGRRPSQQADIGRPISGEFARRPSQQVPAVGGSFPTRLPQHGPSRRSTDDLYSRRPSQEADPARPGDRMLMKRPSQQFVMSFEGIQEL